jgi:hypothetical protein
MKDSIEEGPEASCGVPFSHSMRDSSSEYTLTLGFMCTVYIFIN